MVDGVCHVVPRGEDFAFTCFLLLIIPARYFPLFFKLFAWIWFPKRDSKPPFYCQTVINFKLTQRDLL